MHYLRIKIVSYDHIIVGLIVFGVVAALREGVGDVVLSFVPVPPRPRARQLQTFKQRFMKISQSITLD